MMLPTLHSWGRSNCFTVWMWKSFQGGGSSKEPPLRWSRVALYLFILRTSFVAPYSPEGVPWNIFHLKRSVRSQDIWGAPGPGDGALRVASVLGRQECRTLTHCLAELYLQPHTGGLSHNPRAALFDYSKKEWTREETCWGFCFVAVR